MRQKIGYLAIAVLGASLALSQDASHTIRGRVQDQSGYAVPNASITLRTFGYERTTSSGIDGGFRFEGVPRQMSTIMVNASGFSSFTMSVVPENDQVEIILRLAAVSQEINVTANRVATTLGETAESVKVLSRWNIESAAAESFDQVLREVPGFSLFRRSDSRTANPTTQGASLRSIGGNGASRVVVLFDDIPMNDPFGGWVYWGRIPLVDVSSIEVLRGGGSSLYGSDALSGVISGMPIRATRNLTSVGILGGSHSTADASLAAALQFKPWTFETDGEFFRTGGYIPVPSELRGTIDSPADSSHGDGRLTVRRKIAEGDFFFSGEFYNEDRSNGTLLTKNDTQLWQLNSGMNLLAGGTSIQLRAFVSGQSYNQTFSSIALDRNSELLTRQQHVPAQQAGGSLLMARQAGRNSMLGGMDGRFVRGFSNETAFTASVPTSLIDSGGRQQRFGAFLQDSVRLHPRLLVTLGGRYDNWNNDQAHTSTTPLAASSRPSFTRFNDESEHAFSPRAALLFHAGSRITLTASAYRAFRAPTLNELYRSFRLGNVFTLADPQLLAERLSGAEAGANFFLKKTHIHTAFFYMKVQHAVENVTLQTTGTLITRQRENLGSTRSRGVESDVSWRFGKLDLIVNYQFADAVVTSFPVNPAFVGFEVPQVASHQFATQGRYSLSRGWTVAAQARASSSQFDDDMNQFLLAPFWQMDVYVAKRLRHVETFAAIENLTGSQIEITKNPTLNVGPHRLVRAGVKMHWGE